MTAARFGGIVGAMAVLAALDFVGALFAKAYADAGRPLLLLAGAATFLLLFVVYAFALRYADVSVVTMGWIVLLQVGLLAFDQRRFGLQLEARQWIAVVAVLALQCYLIVSTSPPAQAPTAQSLPAPTPYLSLDLSVVGQRYQQLSAALPGVRMHYAVKANPAPEVLELLVARGSAFDVASPAEITACLAAGANPRDLSYGNTAKKERDIAFATAHGVDMFTFDDVTELAKLRRSAPGATLLCRLATTGHGADWSLSSKFGCSADSAVELLIAAASAGHPVGVAFHVGSQQRDPGQWSGPLAEVGRLQSELARHRITLSVLDIGGGFPATYREPAPPIGEYGAAIATAIRGHLTAPIARFMAEPGRFIVADAGVIESEVVLVAHRGGRRWVHLDIGMFGGLAEVMDEAIQYRVTTDRDGDRDEPVVLAGPTCDSVDVLYQRADYRLPVSLSAGDRVWLHSTGAYTASYSSVGFNGLPPLATHCTASTSAAPLWKTSPSGR